MALNKGQPEKPMDIMRPQGRAADFRFYSVERVLADLGLEGRTLPFTIRIFIENLIRRRGADPETPAAVRALVAATGEESAPEIAFSPDRILMPDSSAVPFIADLTAIRGALSRSGIDPALVNPHVPVDIVLDHSVIAEYVASPAALDANASLEFAQNRERYAFLRWAQEAYVNLRIVPPGKGIVHQVNLEYLAAPFRISWFEGDKLICPDTLVGTDSHTTMVNALGIIGWGVGGIEAAAAMLGEPISMLVPEVVGCRLVGKLSAGVTSTDLALTITEKLRARGVVGKIIEFFGDGLPSLSLPDRATIANMAPEYGATMGYFPIDEVTISYLCKTARPEEAAIANVYARAQGLWGPSGTPEYMSIVEIDMGRITTSVAGPSRPQDRMQLSDVPPAFHALAAKRGQLEAENGQIASREGERSQTSVINGDVVIAAITSCTNTANPMNMMRAGLLARNAVRRGLLVKPWVKTSLSPGSRVVTAYLDAAGVQPALEVLGFHLTGYGCMTCSGGSGSLAEPIAKAVESENLIVAAVLSGNRNFEGRIHPAVKASFLASPPLVIAFALAGSVLADLSKEPLGEDAEGPIFLSDIWPSDEEARVALNKCYSPGMFRSSYKNLFEGSSQWDALASERMPVFSWDDQSTYVREPPFVANFVEDKTADFRGARILALLGDNVTTDHISPGGQIPAYAPAGRYLINQGTDPADFNSYSARRANHEVMVRGTFGSLRLCNEMVPCRSGGYTRYHPTGEIIEIFDASERYRKAGVPLVVIAGKEYGTGSSRDWAAKGTALLGVRAVVAESFERIHRSNLVGMGVLPLQFENGQTRQSLGLRGDETLELLEYADTPLSMATLQVAYADQRSVNIQVRVRVDSKREVEWLRAGGILPLLTRQLAQGLCRTKCIPR